MAEAELDDARELKRGRAGPDLQEDILDSQQVMGLQGELDQQATEQEIAQLDVLAGLRSLQTPDPITWRVYRTGHEESKFNGYLSELQTSSLTQEYLRRNFGGGRYTVRGTFPNGKYATQRTVTIAGESILYIPKTVNGAAPVQSGAPAFDMNQFMMVQQQLDEKRQQAEDRRRQDEDARAERRAKETREFILGIGAVVAPVITALVSKAAAPDNTAALITALKPSGTESSPMSSMKGMLEMMTMMREILEPASGGSDAVEMVKAVSGIATPVLTAFASSRAQAPVPPRPRVNRDPTQQPSRPAPVTIDVKATPPPVVPPVPTAPVGSLPTDQPSSLQGSAPSTTGVDMSAPTQTFTPEQQSMFAQLKPQVDTLVQLATDKADPNAVAEMFFEQYLTTVDDDTYERMCALFENPKTLDQMAIFNKGVHVHRDWFEALQAALVKKINTESAQATIENVDSAPESA